MLYKLVANEADGLLMPYDGYQPLNHDAQEQRFLNLLPFTETADQESDLVKCSMEVQTLGNVGKFVAVKNSRGYRPLHASIEINGQKLEVSVALERFLRHFRRADEPVKLWIRHICLAENDDDECARYWNRTFIDSMYERASEVVDMSEFNNKLLDDGRIMQACEPKYLEWTKEWNDGGEMGALPRIFPVRLRQPVSLSDPPQNFAYVPLDLVTNETRILVIHPSEESTSPIEAGLAHCPVKCEVTFHALSYTWGNLPQTVDIILNSEVFKITKHLDEFLKALRHPKKLFVVWIDAICINQSDIAERNRTVPRISQVYDTATAVLCNIGPLDDDANEALDFVTHLKVPHVVAAMRFDDDGNWITRKDAKIEREAFPKLCAALYKLLLRPYFRRVWILQEIAFASNPVIVCGNRHDVMFDDLEMAAYNLMDMIRQIDGLVPLMKLASPGLTRVSEAELVYIRKLAYFKHVTSRGQGHRDIFWRIRRHDIGKNSPAMLEAVMLAREFQASVGHDKIFALWNLAKDKEGFEFKMDYAQSVPTSFTNFTVSWTTHFKSLNILAMACTHGKSIEFYKEAPTWCPDWTTPAEINCLVLREHIPVFPMGNMRDLGGSIYSADGGMKNDDFDHPLFEIQGNSLLCTAVIVDRLQTASGYADPRVEESYGEFGDIEFWSYLQAVTDFYGARNENPYKDPRRAAWAMMYGDVTSTWLPREQSQNCDDNYPEEEYVCEYENSKHITRWGDSYDRPNALDGARATLKGRRLAFSEKGYMCLVPGCVDGSQPLDEWLLAIVATCSVPLLLKKVEDGTYQVAGSCFVQGWMEGEILVDVFGAVDAKEFWAARKGCEKLEII